MTINEEVEQASWFGWLRHVADTETAARMLMKLGYKAPETSPTLTKTLIELGDEFGAMGVALAAAELTDRRALVQRLKLEDANRGGQLPQRPVKHSQQLPTALKSVPNPEPERIIPGRITEEEHEQRPPY